MSRQRTIRVPSVKTAGVMPEVGDQLPRFLTARRIWLPSGDSVRNRTLLDDRASAGVGGLFYFKAGELNYRSYVAVGEANVTILVREIASTRKCQIEARDADATYGGEPSLLVFLQRSTDGGTDFASIHRTDFGMTLSGIKEASSLLRARQMVQWQDVTVTGTGVSTAAQAFTWPTPFATLPRAVANSNSDDALVASVQDLTTTGGVIHLRHIDGANFATATLCCVIGISGDA